MCFCSGVFFYSRVNSVFSFVKVLFVFESKDVESDNSFKVEVDDGEESLEYLIFVIMEESDVVFENVDEEDEWFDMCENNSIILVLLVDDVFCWQCCGIDGLGGFVLLIVVMIVFRDYMIIQFQ